MNVARKEGARSTESLPRSRRYGPGAARRTRRRGSLALLGGTDISYVVQDSPMEVKERPQNVVSFVSFRDLDAAGASKAAPAVRIGGMDVLLNVDINNDVKAGVDLGQRR